MANKANAYADKLIGELREEIIEMVETVQGKSRGYFETLRVDMERTHVSLADIAQLVSRVAGKLDSMGQGISQLQATGVIATAPNQPQEDDPWKINNVIKMLIARKVKNLLALRTSMEKAVSYELGKEPLCLCLHCFLANAPPFKCIQLNEAGWRMHHQSGACCKPAVPTGTAPRLVKGGTGPQARQMHNTYAGDYVDGADWMAIYLPGYHSSVVLEGCEEAVPGGGTKKVWSCTSPAESQETVSRFCESEDFKAWLTERRAVYKNAKTVRSERKEEAAALCDYYMALAETGEEGDAEAEQASAAARAVVDAHRSSVARASSLPATVNVLVRTRDEATGEEEEEKEAEYSEDDEKSDASEGSEENEEDGDGSDEDEDEDQYKDVNVLDAALRYSAESSSGSSKTAARKGPVTKQTLTHRERSALTEVTNKTGGSSTKKRKR